MRPADERQPYPGWWRLNGGETFTGIIRLSRTNYTGGRREVTRFSGKFEAPPDKVSTFVHGQTEQIEIAGAMGLGVFDRRKMDVRRIALKA